MGMRTSAVAYFDVLSTLADVRIGPDGEIQEGGKVEKHLEGTLDALRRDGVGLGLIWLGGARVATGSDEAFRSTGLLRYFSMDPVVQRGEAVVSTLEYAAAAARRAHAPTDGGGLALMFVSGSAHARVQARTAGFLTSPHPILARAILRRRSPLRYLRIRVPPLLADTGWPETLRARGVAPLHVSADARGIAQVVAVADLATAAELDTLGFWVDRLGADDEPHVTEAYLLPEGDEGRSSHPPPDGRHGYASDEEAPGRVLASTHEGLLVSIAGGRSLSSYRFPLTPHAATKLLPALSLLNAAESRSRFAPNDPGCKVGSLSATVTHAEKLLLEAHIAPERMEEYIRRYSGANPLYGTKSICSRNLFHPHNAVAVQALLHDLGRIGEGQLNPCPVPFQHASDWYDNVEAKLEPHNRRGVVIVSAHLDSTAAESAEYDHRSDPAPGADDDASGVAGVLCAAAALLALAQADAGRDRHEIRFVLFNGEEEQRAGSAEYAKMAGEGGVPIIAVFQMDMIGYDVLEPPTFQIHAGYQHDSGVQKCSKVLSRLVKDLVPGVVGARLKPQRWPNDLVFKDPAEGLSDHSSFHRHKFAACLISEDLDDEPRLVQPAEKNPCWHRRGDVAAKVNFCYAADIARTVAAAAWVVATR